ncbi:PAS domain-containing protein [Bacteroidota bacterium]
MTDIKLYESFLNSMKNPFMFVDNEHIIKYMNKAAINHYDNGAELLGTSIFDCHNEDSNKMIKEIYEKMQNGLDEEIITDNEKYRIYMRAVRDDDGILLGYYERYEPPVK